MSESNSIYLVTGAMGCIGAWTLYQLAQEGKHAVAFDLSENRSRLDLLLERGEQEAAITFVRGDLTDPAQVKDVFQKYGVTHVIHLAALQVPFCRANPILGAQVNVVGTVNMFEAAKASGVKHLAYASSVAIYGPPDQSEIDDVLYGELVPNPATLYGVYKVANQGTARVYWLESGISSTCLRPFTVYGVARDQGLTSDPTKAMLAAAAGKPFHINFNGPCQYHYTADVARLFIRAAERPMQGALGFDLGGDPVTSEEIAALIRAECPDSQITWTDSRLPFPAGVDGSALAQAFPDVPPTPLEQGVAQTIAQFRKLLEKGKLSWTP